MALLDLGQRSTGPAAALEGALNRLREVLARRSLVRRTVRELQDLDDRELADIGLSRGELRSAATRAAIDWQA